MARPTRVAHQTTARSTRSTSRRRRPRLLTRYSFAGNPTGRQPTPGLVQVGGLLYGVALRLGPNGNGTVFSFNPVSGQTVVLKAFGPSGAIQPVGALIEVGGDLDRRILRRRTLPVRHGFQVEHAQFECDSPPLVRSGNPRWPSPGWRDARQRRTSLRHDLDRRTDRLRCRMPSLLRRHGVRDGRGRRQLRHPEIIRRLQRPAIRAIQPPARDRQHALRHARRRGYGRCRRSVPRLQERRCV